MLAWIISSYKLMRQLLTGPRVSKNAREHWPALRNGEIPPARPMISWATFGSMASAYGTEHARLGKLVAKAFELGSLAIARGEPILTAFGAAGRDPRLTRLHLVSGR